MIKKLKNNQVQIVINYKNIYLCDALYCKDIANDFIDAFLEYFNTGKFHIEFECETYQSALVFFNNNLYFISNEGLRGGLAGAVEITNELCGLPDDTPLDEKMCFLAKELINDIRNTFMDWVWWNAITVTDAVENEHRLEDKLAELYIYT